MAEADRLVQPATTTAPVTTTAAITQTTTTTTIAGPVVVDPHHHHHEPSSSSHIAKGLIAFLQMAFAIILFGLIAFIATGAQLAITNPNNGTAANNTGIDGVGNGTGIPGPAAPAAAAPVVNDPEAFVGLNNAGIPMLYFGLIFAVLQAVTAAAMITQISLLCHKAGHATITALLKVTTAIGFLAMGLACRHINLGEPAGADPGHVRITHTIEAFLIINWFFTWVFLILSLIGTVNWNGIHEHHDHLTRQHALSILQFMSALLLVGLVAGEFQMLTNNGIFFLNALNGTTGWLFISFAALFAVLQLMSGLTMYQQCMKQTPLQTSETVNAVLKVALALGILAFGFACRHIWLGLPSGSSLDAQALVIAIESWVIINFFITVWCVIQARRYDWSCLVHEHHGKTRLRPHVFAIIQTILAIVLIGLLAGEMQHLTGLAVWNPASVALNNAGLFMLGFGLIFSVLEAAAGISMIEQMLKVRGSDANLVFVTNKVALAVGVLAMGFACRHIYLTMRDGNPQGSDDSSVALVHAIEAFLIINFFVTWAIQSRSSSVDW